MLTEEQREAAEMFANEDSPVAPIAKSLLHLDQESEFSFEEKKSLGL
jgi:hypothetical protein